MIRAIFLMVPLSQKTSTTRPVIRQRQIAHVAAHKTLALQMAIALVMPVTYIEEAVPMSIGT